MYPINLPKEGHKDDMESLLLKKKDNFPFVHIKTYDTTCNKVFLYHLFTMF